MPSNLAASTSAKPAVLQLADMAADLFGVPDGRAPLLLLHGLTFDRTSWRPVLDALQTIDPDRQVLAVDLPGHGESAPHLPHTFLAITDLLRQAVDQAGLSAPVVVGHSISGGLASMYAARHPCQGVINVDGAPDPGTFGLLQAHQPAIRGSGFPAIWRQMVASFRLDELPPAARQLVESTSRPSQGLVVSYWEDLLTMAPDRQNRTILDGMHRIGGAGIPYLLIAGSQPPQTFVDLLRAEVPAAAIEIWSHSGHFPQLAHPRRFAERLAVTGQWRPEGPSRKVAALP